jgi:hypothetical protein
VLHLDLTVFVPALRDDPAEATWPNGRRGRDLTNEDIDDIAAWLIALRDAGNALSAAGDLRVASGGLRI